VLEFMHRHPIAQHWGRADLASSDMMSLETTKTVWQARADPRRRTASIGVYTHVRDRWGIFYDQPIVRNERQAGVAIEGVIRQSSTDDVAMLAVDTHGYTDFEMALARTLGFDLCPRLAHLRDRRLHAPVDSQGPADLAAITDCDVQLDAIETIWDDFVRVAASVQSGHCTAVQALARFGSAARGQPLYDGGVHLGRLFRFGITPTANRLYQLVRKGSMGTPTAVLAEFWTALREKSRVRLERPDLPPEVQAAAGDLVAALWERSTAAAAHAALGELRLELDAEKEAGRAEITAAHGATARAEARTR
jgi:hypothetical protein